MAVGDLVTEDWGFEYRGLGFGGSGDMQIAPGTTGLWDNPDVNASDQRRLRRHGYLPGDDFMGGREVIIPIEIDGSNTAAWEANLQSLKQAMACDPDATNIEDQLVFQVPGVASGNKVFIYARPRGLAVPALDQAWFYELPVVNARFVATSPFIYSNTLTTLTMALSGVSSGRTWPITWPLTWGTTTPATTTATNNGTHRAEWTATIVGPLSNPRIENVTQGRTVGLTIELGATDTVVIDSDTRTAYLNGATNVYTSLTTTEWFALGAADDAISFRATAGTGSLNLAYRDTWA